MRFLLSIFKLLFGLLICCVVLVAIVMNLGFSPVGPGQPQHFHVKKDESGHEIAQDLQDQRLIRNGLLFQLLLRFSGKQTKIVPGDYMISPSEDPNKILQHLVQGESVVHTVTFTEGQTAEQMAHEAAQAGICTADDYLKVVRNPPASLREGLGRGSLEGFLFPDTYDIDEGMDALAIVTRQVKRFDEQVMPQWSSHHPAHQTVFQMVTLASLVEREAVLDKERPHIAGVLLHRLKAGMPLQCDATVQYALGEQKPVLSYADLKIDSPYNTYIHTGLPPGPIGNPGLSCMLAAMAPAHTDDLFYVRNDIKNDGSHVFTRTYAEHQAAIQKYQR